MVSHRVEGPAGCARSPRIRRLGQPGGGQFVVAKDRFEKHDELAVPARRCPSDWGIERPLQTGCCRSNLADNCRRLPRPVGKRFEARRTGPHRNLTLATPSSSLQATSCSSGRQWLLSKAANWNCRPKVAVPRLRTAMVSAVATVLRCECRHLDVRDSRTPASPTHPGAVVLSLRVASASRGQAGHRAVPW